jgi:hypothetical protein
MPPPKARSINQSDEKRASPGRDQLSASIGITNIEPNKNDTININDRNSSPGLLISMKCWLKSNSTLLPDKLGAAKTGCCCFSLFVGLGVLGSRGLGPSCAS